MKHLICALALCATLAPALAQDAATPPVAATAPATTEPQSQSAPLPAVKLDNGLFVTPVARPASDLEAIADVHFWRFHIESSAVNGLSQRLELRVPGEEPQRVGAGGLGLSNLNILNLLVGIAPVDSGYLQSAGKWKIYYRMQGLSQDSKPFDIPITTESDNPIKSLRVPVVRYGNGGDYALPQTNGDVPLISIYEQNIEGEKQTLVAELVLVLTARPAKK